MALDRLMAQAERDGDDIQLGLLKEMREAGQTALDRTIGRPTQRSENLHAHAHGTLQELRAMSTEQLLARLEENGGELPPAA